MLVALRRGGRQTGRQKCAGREKSGGWAMPQRATAVAGTPLYASVCNFVDEGYVRHVAPYFVSVTTIFALFLAFHAAFHEAVTALSRLNSLFAKEGLGLENARTHLSRYADAVVREEWAIDNTQPSPRADQELENLRQALIASKGTDRADGIEAALRMIAALSAQRPATAPGPDP